MGPNNFLTCRVVRVSGTCWANTNFQSKRGTVGEIDELGERIFLSISEIAQVRIALCKLKCELFWCHADRFKFAQLLVSEFIDVDILNVFMENDVKFVWVLLVLFDARDVYIKCERLFVETLKIVSLFAVSVSVSVSVGCVVSNLCHNVLAEPCTSDVGSCWLSCDTACVVSQTMLIQLRAKCVLGYILYIYKV